MESNCVFCGNPGAIYRKYLDDVVCDQCLYYIIDFDLTDQQKEEIVCFFNCLDQGVANYHIPEVE